MKTIDLVDAFNLMRLAEGAILEGRLVELSLIGIEHDPKNEFAYISWSEDVRGEIIEFDVAFRESDNAEVLVDGPYLTLVNADTGEEEEIMLLKAWDIEEAYDNGGPLDE